MTQNGGLMTTMTDSAARTAHLLALMKKGDDAFNDRDFAAVDAVHHPKMVAHITGNAQPIYGSVKHAEAMQQMLRIFPDMHVYTPYPIQLGSGDWITVITRSTGTFKSDHMGESCENATRQPATVHLVCYRSDCGRTCR